MCEFAYLTEEMPASVHTPAPGTLISLCQSPPYITVNSRKCCLHKSLACFSSGHLWILFNSSFFHSEHMAGWMCWTLSEAIYHSMVSCCVGDHSTALSPQNEKTRARGNKVRWKGKGDGRSEKLKNNNRQMEKKRRGENSNETKKEQNIKMNKTWFLVWDHQRVFSFSPEPIFLPSRPALAV